MHLGQALKSLMPWPKMPQAKVPEGTRIYAVGDIHGCAGLLDATLARIDGHRDAQSPASTIEVFLGDYVDRGPHSREVIDRLIERRRTRAAVCLAGNHEIYVLEFLKNPAVFADWKQFGALATLQSYGLSAPAEASDEEVNELAQAFGRILPASHRNFLESLTPSYECGDYFFVHAGVRPGVALADQRLDDMLWIRQVFLDHAGDFGKVIVHGHTPVSAPEVRSNRINIDTGAFSTGQLTCLVLEADKISFL